jgi:WD40 repeat protein
VGPDGSWVAYVESGTNLRIWDAAQGGVRHAIEVPDGRVCRLQASPDGRTILAFVLPEAESEWALDGMDLTGNHQRLPESVSLRCYDVSSGQERLQVAGSRGIVDISPDGKLIAWGDTEGSVRIAEFGSRNAIREYRSHDVPVTAVVLSGDGQRIAAGGENGEVLVWDALSDVPRLRLLEHEAEICALQFSFDAARLASFSIEGRCSVWDVSSDRQPSQASLSFPADIVFPNPELFPKDQQPDPGMDTIQSRQRQESSDPWDQIPGDEYYAPMPPGWGRN